MLQQVDMVEYVMRTDDCINMFDLNTNENILKLYFARNLILLRHKISYVRNIFIRN